MLKKFTAKLARISSRTAIVGALILVLVIAGVALLLTRGGSNAKANSIQPMAARLDKLDGSVGIARVVNGDQEPDWREATLNTPITVGDRIFARDYAHASVALTAHNYVRMNPSTSLDVLALEDHRTQLALRSGSALFDVGALGSDDLYEVATPYGAVDFKQPGLYQVGLDGDNAIISVLNGLAQVVGQEGSGFISRGQVFTLVGAEAPQALASTLAPDTAGEIVDDYYRYRYPKIYNGRYRNYNTYVSDPSFYDPYRTSVSYQYLPADIPGLYDLDDYGDWLNVGDYGYCWAPRVSDGWAPYRSGYWDLDNLFGPSWVSYEPWGWAPYHYGRWAFVNQRWYWVPTEVVSHHVYCPAPVAFIPVADQIAWIPLGPGEVYVPRYYDDFRPRYLAPTEVIRVVSVQNTFVNFNAPGAITAVPVSCLTRVIDPRTISSVDTALIARSRPVIDPFSVDAVRELAVRHDDARRRIKIERREQEALNAKVFTSTSPEVLAARGNLEKAWRVQEIKRKRDNKLKITETSQITSLRRPDGLPQPIAQTERLKELASRADQGDKSARREMRQLLRQEQREGQQAGSQQSAQEEQLRQQMKQQRRAERQQQATPPPQQEGAQNAQQQAKQQRRLERQQQSATAQQAQQQQLKQQRRMGRQQQAAAAQQAQPQQMKQQRQAEQQRQSAVAAQRQQVRQQNKQLRRKPPQEFQQEQLRQGQQQAAREAQMSQLLEQQKAQRRAEQQQRTTNAQMKAQAAAQAQQAQAQQRAQRQQAIMQQQQAARAQGKQAARAQQQVMQQQQAAQRQQQLMQQQEQAARAQQQQAARAQRQEASQSGPPAQNPGQARKAEKRKPPQ